MPWTFAHASQVGSVHPKQPCQDKFACETVGNALIAVVSDGAGSAEFGADGAETVCAAFLTAARKVVRNPAKAKDSTLKALVVDVIRAVEARAKARRKPIASFSSTLVGVVAGPTSAIVVQIGDGAAVLEVDGEFHVPIWPRESEFLNVTWFVTSPQAKEHVTVARVHKRVDSVTAFSDGLQLLVLDGKSRTPHEPFFVSVRDRLDMALVGLDERASAWLATVLTSSQVTSRTDDDTCLIVGKRNNGRR